MSTFSVTAVTKDGEEYHEVVEAADRFQVYRDIRERGDRILSLEDKASFSLSLASFGLTFGSVKQDEKVILARNLAAMIEAGLTTSRALSVMERQTTNKLLKNTVGALIAEVKSGNTLSSALAKFPNIFSSLMVSMVRAGEESGKLAESLRVVALEMERSSQLTKKIRGAMIYPAIVVIAMIGIGILMLIYVVPTLSETFKDAGATLPPTTMLIINTSKFLVEHTILALLGMIAFVGLLVYGARTPRGKHVFSYLFLHLPVIRTIVVETYAARTARTLASLLSAGVDVLFALHITRDVVANPYYQRVLSDAEATVQKGGSLSATFALSPKLYPPLVTEMIAVGEETGRLADLLKEAAQFYEDSVDRATRDLSTIVEPVLMLAIGAFVGFFAISMIAPIYSLSNAI